MRVVIVDDEALARARLARLLGAHPDVEVVGELGDARRAMTEVAGLAPDLVLLDVRMPRHDGFDVAAALAGRPCAVVFVTAWSDHAVRAFDAGAADYLMKPVDGERLALALERVRARMAPQSVSPIRVTPSVDRLAGADAGCAYTEVGAGGPAPKAPARLADAGADAEAGGLERRAGGEAGGAGAELGGRGPAASVLPPVAIVAPAAPVVPPRVAVRDGGRLVFVPVADVDAVVARGNYVELRARGRGYTVRATLHAIAAQLEPAAFVRIHRSVLVRVERIAAIEPLFRGEYLVTLTDGATFTSARGQRAELRRALGLP